VNKLLAILPAILLGYRIVSRIKDPAVRKRVKHAFSDGLVTRKEWEGVGQDLGVFKREGD
jgi:hypothetical protein